VGTPKTFWDGVEQELAKLPDDGPITQKEVRVWAKWHTQLVNLLESIGYYYRGESFKDQGWSTLLVLKVAREGTPLVAFVTERTPTDCMRVCLDLIEGGRVGWREDRFS
jgi:hypothetical protein